MRHPVVMGNWKLNGSKEMVSDLLKGLNAELEGVEGVDVAVAPPALYIDLAEREIAAGGNKIILGAQNTDLNNSGAFTGDMSPAMLKDFGASHIIIGHSERREYHAESDEFVAKKFAFLKENGLTPVLCIGESDAQNEAGETMAVCARQIDAVINTLGVDALNGAIIAYEPIWLSVLVKQQQLKMHNASTHKFVLTSQRNLKMLRKKLLSNTAVLLNQKTQQHTSHNQTSMVR